MTTSTSTPSTPSSGARADWYPDPHNPALLRYWNGRQWTGHTSPRPPGWGGQQWRTYAPEPGGRRTGETARRRSGLSTWVVVALVSFVSLAGLVVAGSLVSATDPGPRRAGDASAVPSHEPTLDATEAAAPSSAPEPAPAETEPPEAVVPRLVGLTRAKAEQRLTAVGLMVSDVQKVFSAKAPGTVLRQGRKVGASVLTGTAVVLVVAKPYPQVPGVVGRVKAAAVQQLQDAGFKVVVTTETRSSGKDGVVLRQTPGGAASAKPRSTVSIVISNVVRPVAPPQNCTAGYDPCLAPASDYDCAGGSGDGPAYTGYVVVTGADPYDLDADGDGVACE